MVTGVLLLGLAALVVFESRRVRWDWGAIGSTLRHANGWTLVAAVTCIYAGMPLRAVRWASLMRGQRRVQWSALLVPQWIGFAAVGLFGRLADLTRPALIAQRTETTVAGQVGVYSLERIFDLAAAAVLFSVTLLMAPRAMPHHQAIVRAGVMATAGTALLLMAALLVRSRGAWIAAAVGRGLRPVSAKAAAFAAERVLEFQHGLRHAGSAAMLLAAMGVSIAIWVGIAAAYVLTVRSFPGVAALAVLTVAQVMLLMATSLGSSLLQVPVLGWFTQVGLVATALDTLLGVPLAAALAAAIALFVVTSISIIPVGLVAAQREGVSLRAR